MSKGNSNIGFDSPRFTTSPRILFLAILVWLTILPYPVIAEDKKFGTEEDAEDVLFRKALRAEFNKAYPTEPPVPSREHVFELVAQPTTVKQIDGRDLKVWAYNKQVPGPVLRIKYGESIKVILKNKLPQPTTIHWHGVRVPNNMDGVPGVTQAPVLPGESFTYRFTPKDAGTFWFHPHVRTSEQVERGLYGAFIVEDEEEYPYSRDILWIVDDWRLGKDGQIDPNFNTRHDLMHDGRWGTVVTVNGSTNTVTKLRPGERIRLRVLNTANGRVFRPRISGIKAEIVAVDGLYTRTPVPLEGFDLVPGGRIDLDFIVPRNFNGRRLEVTDHMTRRVFNIGSFIVEGEPVSTPSFAKPRNLRVPSWVNGREMPIDETFVLDSRSGGKFGITWTINGKPWGEHTPTNLVADRWTKLRFQNDSFRLHPMHLHGQFFKVLTRNEQAVEEPFFRDTVLLRRKDVVDVALVPMDYGKWMMHCHILEHAAAGMMTLVEVE